MSDSTIWPNQLADEDDLWVGVDAENDSVRYLVFSSSEDKCNYVRSNGGWFKLSNDPNDMSLDDLRVVPVELGIIAEFDRKERAGRSFEIDDLQNFLSPVSNAPKTAAMTAAAPDDCPPATLDIVLNLSNREKAIEGAGYGPLNPELSNTDFWNEKASRWSVTIDEAKQSLCGNCAMFVVTENMRSCISAGIEQGGSSEQNAWDAIDAAELGYCEAFDFKCAASRTCDAWVTGGPVTDSVQ
jgi:hypothetical protein